MSSQLSAALSRAGAAGVGLLGAAEGLAFLAALAVVGVFGLQIADVGFVPAPLPSEACFGN